MNDVERAELLRDAAVSQHAQPEAACETYRRIIAARPNDVEALLNLGVLTSNAGDFEGGLALVRRCLRLAPHNQMILGTMLHTAQRARRFDEVLTCANRLLAIAPGDCALLTARAGALASLERDEEALEAAQQAVLADPSSADAQWVLARALSLLGEPQQAIAHAEAAVARRADHAPALYTAALEWLRLGHYARGWPLYEWRFLACPHDPVRLFGRQQWFHTDKLEGQRILLHSEQGYGDTIQFCRYAPLMAARGAHVILEVPKPLAGLMRRLDGVAEVFAVGDPLPDVHTHAPLMTLPLEFSTTLETIPATVPYLHAEPARLATWAARLGPRCRPRIGLAWSSNRMSGRKRHLPLAALAPLLALDAEFIALQTELTPADRDAAGNLRGVEGEIADFDDTAALIALCDIVVTVDTPVAHLAGAMGVPAWIMLAHTADWRWLRERQDSPWYPSARLFRQPARGDWHSVVAAVTAALGSRLENFATRG